MRTLIPYTPSLPARIETILKLIKIKPGQRVVDLGSGDGRLLVATAKKGATAYGYEIREKYYRRSKQLIQKEGLQDKAFVYHCDFWKKDLSPFDLVFIYGIDSMMLDLAEKLKKELKNGAVVVSNGFKIPGWEIWKEEKFIYAYIKT